MADDVWSDARAYIDVRNQISDYDDDWLRKRRRQLYRIKKKAVLARDVATWELALTELEAINDELAYRRDPPMDHLDEQ